MCLCMNLYSAESLILLVLIVFCDQEILVGIELLVLAGPARLRVSLLQFYLSLRSCGMGQHVSLYWGKSWRQNVVKCVNLEILINCVSMLSFPHHVSLYTKRLQPVIQPILGQVLEAECFDLEVLISCVSMYFPRHVSLYTKHLQPVMGIQPCSPHS